MSHCVKSITRRYRHRSHAGTRTTRRFGRHAVAFGFATIGTLLVPAAHGTESGVSVSTVIRVISDPFNGHDNPKMIPGAVAEYCISVDNAGTETVQDVRVDVPVPDEVTVIDESLSLQDSGCEAPPAATGPDVSITQSGGAIVALIDFIAPGTTWSARFNVTIN